MSQEDPLIGRKIQDYKLTALLGKGGMGKVYLAQHPLIGKKVAIKVLHPGYAQSEEILARLFREAQAVNEIHHENVIDIVNFLQLPETDEYCIIMEYLEGDLLTKAIDQEGPFSTERIGHIGLQICSALHATHQKNIIHRDLKSDNIFLTERAGQRDFVKVLDFGLAKLQEGHGGHNLTEVGVTLGTPAYMSPEQAGGEDIDAQADVYSLGVILYEMATKTLPFTGVNFRDVMKKQMFAKLPKPRERFAKVHPALEAVIVRALEKEKQDRYLSMLEVASELSEACGLSTEPYFGKALAAVRLSAPEIPAVAKTTNDENRSAPAIVIKDRREGTKKNKWALPVLASGAIALSAGAYIAFSNNPQKDLTPTSTATSQVKAKTPPVEVMPSSHVVVEELPPSSTPTKKPKPKPSSKPVSETPVKASSSGRTTEQSKQGSKGDDELLPGP